MAIQEVKIVADLPKQERPTIACGPGRTKQEFKKDTDVNVIVRTFQKTGVINFRDSNEAKYGDIDPVDFHQAMNTVARAGEMFDALPANIRKKFGHDPGEFLEYIQNPDNAAEARELGLLSPDLSGDIDNDGIPDIVDPVDDSAPASP